PAPSPCTVSLAECNRSLHHTEWDGPAALPPPTALRVRRGLFRRRSAVMPRTSTVHAVTTIGMDIGKNTLHMIGLDKRGAIVLREKVSRGRIALRLVERSRLCVW